MITTSILETIENCKKESKIAVLKDFCTNTPSWQEFIDYIDKTSNAENPIMGQPNERDKKFGAVTINNLMIKENFYFYMSGSGLLGESSEKIEKEFTQVFNVPGGISTVYVTLSSNLNPVESHCDTQEVLYWQCIGSTTWNSQGETYTVNPGDMVYVPCGVYHAVNFPMPRAAIGFSWKL
jgi:mannose-6-phosphate isomerase-like protein (cupin superfamily)